MSRFSRLAALAAAVCIAGTGPALAQSQSDEARFAAAQQRLQTELANFRAEYDRYQAARSRYQGQGGRDPRYQDQRGYQDQRQYSDDRLEADYDAARYYRGGTNYQERVLSNDERVYRGNDGRYYCKRNDGTTGLVIGGAAGGVLGNVIDGGHSRTVGTLLGAAVGALAGRAVDQNNSEVRCR